ncbi:MAG TPA: PEGA domain-containing protein [Methanoregula sp.]|nr:PEGA domain-containing protein [Methanoregula sp.]
MPAPAIIALALVILGVLGAGCDSTPALQPENGSVRILSSPPGAEIYLDSEYRGTTPATVQAVPAGGHSLEIRQDGYDPWSGSVAVRAGSMVNVSATLIAIPETALPVIYATPAVAVQRGMPEIHVDGYWTVPPAAGSSTTATVPVLVHTNGFNVGDAGAREVTVSAKLYYGGHAVCWETVYLGTLSAGGHVATDTMLTCPLPSGFNSGDLTIRFDNIVVRP